jgi:hypothetical protein
MGCACNGRANAAVCFAFGAELAAVPLLGAVQVKQKSNVDAIAVRAAESESEAPAANIFIESYDPEAANTARVLLEVHFREQLKVVQAEQRMLRLQQNLAGVQGELAAGLRVELQVATLSPCIKHAVNHDDK